MLAPLQEARDQLLSSVVSAGLTIPPSLHDMPPEATLVAYLYPFARTEVVSASYLDLPSKDTLHLHKEQIALRAGSETGNPQVLRIARSVGAMLGAALSGELMVSRPLLKVTPSQLQVATGKEVTAAFHSCHRILEWGMGVNGLAAHIGNLRASRYHVTAVQLYPGEKAYLDGAAEHLGFTNNLQVRDGGILRTTQQMLAENRERFDTVIASRVHSAREDLTKATAQVAGLLQDPGLFVAVGPESHKGYGYSALVPVVGTDSRLEVIHNRTFTTTLHSLPNEEAELDRIIIAQRVQP